MIEVVKADETLVTIIIDKIVSIEQGNDDRALVHLIGTHIGAVSLQYTIKESYNEFIQKLKAFQE